MADNFDFTEGSGKTGAADDVSGVLFAKVKLDLGTDGVSAPVLAGAGVVATGVQRITLASDDPAVTLLGTIDTDTGVIAGDTTSIDGKITACNTGAVVLATGSAAIGKLAANDGVDIGNVDVTSVVPGVAATSLGKAKDSALGATDTGVMALAVRDDTLTTLTPADGDYVPLRVGSTGKLHVTDANITACNTGAVVISSGTVTTVSTVTSLSQLGGQAINLGEGTIATGTQRITLATDDDAVASLGIIDDWDATHASAAPADGAQVMGAAYSTALPTDVGADADAARLVTDRYGRLCTGLQPQAAKAILDNADTTTAREIVGAVASRKIYITSLILSVDTAGNYWLEDGDATAVTGKFYLAANGGVAITFPEGTPLNTVTVNKALNVKGSASGNVGVTVTYYLAV